MNLPGLHLQGLTEKKGRAAVCLRAASWWVQVPLSVSNGQFFGTDGGPITLKGVNWFGFETSNTLMDGLWQGPTALTQDFGTVAYRIQLLGFNAIRLPFSFQVSTRATPCVLMKRPTLQSLHTSHSEHAAFNSFCLPRPSI